MAPGIVEAINQKSNAQEIWNEVYKDLVGPCVNMIHNNKNESAYTLYKLYSLKLTQNTKHKNQKQKVKPDKRLDLLFSYL